MTSSERIIDLLAKYPANAKAIRKFQAKSDGGRRPIAEPNNELNKWLKLMNKALRKHFNNWPSFMHGGIKKRSYVSYAKMHVNKPCVITIDIRQCFDSITVTEVSSALERHLKLPTKVCQELAGRLCFQGKVGQGFATSNYLSNLYLLDPLSSLYSSLRKQGLFFSNYVDDIAISGSINSKDAVINQVATVLSRAKLALNKSKITVMPSSNQQIVCGLVVNKRISLTKTLKLKIMSDVANDRISSSSLDGWLANLRVADPKFGEKLGKYARKKGLIK